MVAIVNTQTQLYVKMTATHWHLRRIMIGILPISILVIHAHHLADHATTLTTARTVVEIPLTVKDNVSMAMKQTGKYVRIHWNVNQDLHVNSKHVV